MEQITLSKSQKIHLSTTEIAQKIRTQLKEFKGCKFSVTTKSYSGGSSITINLMESSLKIIKDFSELTEQTIFNYTNKPYDNFRTKEQLKEMQEAGHHQLNEHTLREEYNSNNWCNGVFLTEEGHNLLKKVVEIADYYNFDESDIQTDYYNVNFAFHLNIGKWDKPFKQV